MSGAQAEFDLLAEIAGGPADAQACPLDPVKAIARVIKDSAAPDLKVFPDTLDTVYRSMVKDIIGGRKPAAPQGDQKSAFQASEYFFQLAPFSTVLMSEARRVCEFFEDSVESKTLLDHYIHMVSSKKDMDCLILMKQFAGDGDAPLLDLPPSEAVYRMVARKEHERRVIELADFTAALADKKRQLFLEATAHSSLAAVHAFRANEYPDAEMMIEEYERHIKYIEMEINRVFKPKFFKESHALLEEVLLKTYNRVFGALTHPKVPCNALKEAKSLLDRLISEAHPAPYLLPAGDKNELRIFDRVQIAYGENLLQGYLVDVKAMTVQIDTDNRVTPSLYPITEAFRVISTDDILFAVAKREEVCSGLDKMQLARQSFEGSFYRKGIKLALGQSVGGKDMEPRPIEEEVISIERAPDYAKLRECQTYGDIALLKRRCHEVLVEAAMQELAKEHFLPRLEKLEDLYVAGAEAHYKRVRRDVFEERSVVELARRIADLTIEIGAFEKWM